MFENRKITFIGPGVMAHAIIGGLIRKNVAAPESICASGPTKSRVDYLNERFGIYAYTDNALAVKDADVVVLSIKPQTLDQVLSELKGKIPERAFVLSIIAGAPISKLARGLGNKNIIRSMPNTPARIGEGITVWTSAPEVTKEQHEMARQILAALGDEIFMDDEKFLNMATALSGTGPAYVFLFMEAMVDAGVHLGFPRRVAEQLVTQTVLGSVLYRTRGKGDPLHLADMRNQVTSPGGTTAAAMYFLEKAGFRTAISRAIWAAYERSSELGIDAKAHAPEPPSSS